MFSERLQNTRSTLPRKDGAQQMKTEKAKLLDFVNNLTEEEFNYLASHFQEIIAELEASAPRPLPDNSVLTA